MTLDNGETGRHAIELLIEKADRLIGQEDFDALLDIYAEDAVLVVRPGMNAVGKQQIRKAFEAIAAHFEHGLKVKQSGMKILETGDTALVLAKTLISADELPVTERKATYVFRKQGDKGWLCAIDNSYGHTLLEEGEEQ